MKAKYRIIKKIEMCYYPWGVYSVTDYFYVQERFLWFFWITIKGFWERRLAESYLEAKKQLSENIY